MGSNQGILSTVEDYGVILDTLVKGGANSFLRRTSNFTLFSAHVEEIKKMQQRKKQWNGNNKKVRVRLHTFFAKVAEADRHRFREKVPKSEVQCWLDFTITEIKRFTSKSEWIATGNLQEHDVHVLSTCITMFNHPVVVVLPL